MLQRELNAAFDETLRQSAFQLLPLALHDIREPDEAGETRVEGLEDQEEYFTYFVRDRAGNVVVRAADVDDEPDKVPLQDGFSEQDGRHLYSVTDQRSGYGIVVIERTNQRTEALRHSLAALTWPLAALIPLIAASIWFAIRFAMRPVERLSRDIAKRDRRNLTPLDLAGQPVELAPIAEAVASLLARLRAALDAERTFAASSAHELRTPIAGALAQTQQLALELGDRPGSARLKEIEASLRHLSQLSEKLLQLSRLSAGFAQSADASDLMPVLRLVVRDFQASAATAARVRLQVAADADLVAQINVDAFAVAVRNLIQNALIHGASDGLVEVFAGPGRLVRVTNAGAIVPPASLARIGEPFVRGTTTAHGSGLGLSIVRAIMEQTGGSLRMLSPATGRADGFEAVLVLP